MSKICWGVLFLFMCSAAKSASIEFRTRADGAKNIILDGPIIKGDSNKLLTLISEDPITFLASRQIQLNSLGGSVSEALAIAGIVDSAALGAVVNEEQTCGSSCVYIWIAAPIRFGMGRLLVHRPYFGSDSYNELNLDEVGQQQRSLMTAVRTFLQERNFPQRLTEEMMARSSEDSYELSLRDITDVGYLSADFEEATIAKCKISEKEIMQGSLSGADWECIGGLGDVQRIRLLVKLIGHERAKAAGEQFLLHKFGPQSSAQEP